MHPAVHPAEPLCTLLSLSLRVRRRWPPIAPPHISSYLAISPHISPYLPISRHISPYLPISRHISLARSTSTTYHSLQVLRAALTVLLTTYYLLLST